MNKLLLCTFILAFVGCAHKNNIRSLEEILSSEVEEGNGSFSIKVLPLSKLEISESVEEQAKNYWNHIAQNSCKGSFEGKPELSFTLISHDGVKDGRRWGYTEMLLKEVVGVATCL